MSRLYTTADAFLSLSDISRNTINSRSRKLLQTSSLSTVGFFFSIDRSMIDRTLRRKFQRRSTQNVGHLTGLFPTVETCISATASTAILTSLLTLRSRRPFERVFFLSSNETSDRHLALT
jgi:hypothetical protein